MIHHYLKIAYRNLLKYRTQSIISIIGLAIGLACFALSTFWVQYEMTYDDFHNAFIWYEWTIATLEGTTLTLCPTRWGII